MTAIGFGFQNWILGLLTLYGLVYSLGLVSGQPQGYSWGLKGHHGLDLLRCLLNTGV